MQTPWEYRYAHRMQKMGSSVIRELLKFTEQPDIISFAGGLPAPEVFPLKEFREACNTVIDHFGPQALQYSTTEGYTPLREMIARHNARYSVEIDPDNILITSGSQQALDFLGRLFINRGDYIVCESPTYLGALQAWNAYGAQYIPVRADENGMIVDELEAALRIGPKFIYVLPNFQNPSGSTLSLERRKQLIELADKYGVPIVEDDPYGQLRYDGEHIPSVVALDSEYRGPSATYKERRDVMFEMMEEMFPPEVTWSKPLGGMFLWGVLPEEMDAADVLKRAIERKVAFVPGEAFHPRGGGKNTMRINFSYSSPDTIREGVTRLGLTLKELIREKV